LSKLKSTWQIQLIGQGSAELAVKIKKSNPEISIQGIEKLSHTEVLQKLTEAKIIFAPSIAESFNLAVAEGLCCGCSFIGGPLPSFIYFSNNGETGFVTKDNKTESFKTALESEIIKWENGGYDAIKIYSYWRKELGLENVSQKIIKLINSL
jgi:glycosyltransferase involved in cell wall biosynthesis